MVDQVQVPIEEFFKNANLLPSKITVGARVTTPDKHSLTPVAVVKGSTSTVATSTPSTLENPKLHT